MEKVQKPKKTISDIVRKLLSNQNYVLKAPKDIVDNEKLQLQKEKDAFFLNLS